MLEREGDVYDKAEDAERMRSVSERVARHDKKMLARASEETDEGKDEAAERRPDSGEAGSIVPPVVYFFDIESRVGAGGI